MAYNSIPEIYEAIDASRGRLVACVESLDEEQARFHSSPDRWSIAEIIEHLSLVEGQVARLCHIMLAKAEAAGATRAADGEGAAPFTPVTIEHLVEELRERKLQAPDNARPGGQLTLGEALARLAESRAALTDLRPRLELVDGTSVRYPHPAAGPIDIYQWLLFLGAHEDRHRLQIEALKQSPGFASSGESWTMNSV